MKTQISRDAHDSDKRYSGVYQQQGRMLTDADWNALADIVKERLDEALADVIGSGSPRGESGFRVANPDPQKEPGASGPVFRGRDLYAEGVPAEVVPAHAGIFNYVNQADFPHPPTLPDLVPTPVTLSEPPPEGDQERRARPVGTFYADVWERTVDALEDTGDWVADHLLDPALHGADTTTRTQTMAQIKWSPKLLSIADLDAIPRIGDARLTVELRAGLTGGGDPCDPCASEVSVTRSTGNYLFRVEVHDVVGTPSTPSTPYMPLIPTQLTLKWSSENGAVYHRVAPLDTVPGDFKNGDYVYEFYNDESEKHLGVHLPAFTPTRGRLFPTYPTTLPTGFDRVRRWDGFAVLRLNSGTWSLAVTRRIQNQPPPPVAANGVNPGDFPGRDRDVQLRASPNSANPGDFDFTDGDLGFHLRSLKLILKAGSFVAGDYWLAPVRESIHQAGAKVLDKAPPIGIRHHYLRLTDIDAGGTVHDPDKYREQHLNFPPLTDIKASDVDYGPACDAPGRLFETKVVGQPVDTVKAALDRLCDIRARHVGYTPPEPCAIFKGFETVEQALNRVCAISATDIAFKRTCSTSLYQGDQPLKTVADVLKLLCDIRAEHIGYTGCPDLQPNIKTVKEALDALCARPSGGVSCRATVGKGGTFETLAAAVASIDPADNNVALCLCLLPGGHPVNEVLTVSGSGTRAVNLTICGCGRASRLLIGQNGRLNFVGVRSLRLENFLLRLDPPAPTDVPAQLSARDGFEVTLEGVIVTGAARPVGARAPVSLQASLSVRVAACRFEILNSEGLATVGTLFTPINPTLGELFSPQLDDDAFAERQKDVAPALVAFPPKRRSVLGSGVTKALDQPPAPMTASLRDSLQRFADAIALPTPDLSAVAACLDDVRAAALSSVPALALVLTSTAGDTTLVDNQILGVVSVYGEPIGDGLTSDQIMALKRDALKWSATSPNTKVQFFPAAGRLYFDRNEMSRLTFGGTPQIQLRDMATPGATGRAVNGIYRAAFLGQNRFTLGGNRVVAKDIKLTDNVFEPAAPDLGAAIAETATYVGNSSVLDDVHMFSNLSLNLRPHRPDDVNYMSIPI